MAHEKPLVGFLLLALICLVPITMALAAENPNPPPAPPPDCFKDFRTCRLGCLTGETRYLFDTIILDTSTNMCLLDCDLGLLACIMETLPPFDFDSRW